VSPGSIDALDVDGRRLGRHAQTSDQDVALRMDGGLLLGDLAAIDQDLDIGMVARALHQALAAEMVDA
jgi:hypothetical protein